MVPTLILVVFVSINPLIVRLKSLNLPIKSDVSPDMQAEHRFSTPISKESVSNTAFYSQCDFCTCIAVALIAIIASCIFNGRCL